MIEAIADGAFCGVITTDLIVSKMSGRDLHPWVLISVMFSMFSYLLTFGIVAVYYLVLFYELATYLGLPMFSLAVNVYVDGVYDMVTFSSAIYSLSSAIYSLSSAIYSFSSAIYSGYFFFIARSHFVS